MSNLIRSNSFFDDFLTKDLFEFIDSKPTSLFSQMAQEMKKVSYLESGYRDPRKYVDINDLANFRTEVVKFIETAKISKNIEKFAQKAKWIKCANILANVGISSFLLGFTGLGTYSEY